MGSLGFLAAQTKPLLGIRSPGPWWDQAQAQLLAFRKQSVHWGNSLPRSNRPLLYQVSLLFSFCNGAWGSGPSLITSPTHAWVLGFWPILQGAPCKLCVLSLQVFWKSKTVLKEKVWFFFLNKGFKKRSFYNPQ